MTSKYCNTGANAIFLREQRRQAEWSLWQHQDTDAHFFQVISIGAELWLLPTRQHDALLLQWIYEPSCLFLSLKLSPYTPSIYFFQYSFVFSSLFGENTTSRYEIFFSFWTFFTQFLLDTVYSLRMYPVCVSPFPHFLLQFVQCWAGASTCRENRGWWGARLQMHPMSLCSFFSPALLHRLHSVLCLPHVCIPHRHPAHFYISNLLTVYLIHDIWHNMSLKYMITL